ncbi:TPA: glycosyltransferase family 52 [Mannheimia haemolytica]
MNLIICLTPLQMLIAETIIKKKQLKNNILVVVAYNDNDKFRYYYNRLSLLCNASYFFLIDNSSLFNRIKAMARLKLFVSSLSKYDFSSCYLASIDCSYIQLITSSIEYQKLYTFDDGTINLLADSSYYRDKSYSLLERVFRISFGVKDTVSSYRKKSILHYTIFKNSQNIISNVEFVHLIEKRYEASKSSDEIKIFLGQPLSEINVERDLLLELIATEKIDFYYPHPREKEIFDRVEYIKSEKIFEDFLLEYLEQNKDKVINVYTFFSTAILNVKDISNVRVISCYSEQIDPRFHNIYNLFQKLNVPIKYIR